MKHIVFILSAYYPKYSAVAYCCESVIQVLKQNYKVTVICLKSILSAPKVETRGSIDIINVSTVENDRRLYLESSKSIFLKYPLLLHRIHSVFKRVVAPTSINRELVDAYWKALQEIKLPIDAIIPAIYPIEGAVAANYHKQKNPNISFYPYIFDDFVESDSLHVHSLIRFLKKEKNKKVEYEIYRTSEKILSMHSRKNYHDNNCDKEINSKIIYLEHPLLIDKGNEQIQKHDNVIRLVFAGSLIRNVREPHYVIKLLKKVRCKKALQIHFVVQGNLANSIKNFSEESNLYIINHGQLNKMEADQILASADILLSIGNIKSKQIPGKVFEYMALGKPIIHFVNDVPDYTHWVLKKYPYAISILKDYAPIQVNIKIVQQFIEKNQNSQITFAETAKIFPEALPFNTAKVIQNLISP